MTPEERYANLSLQNQIKLTTDRIDQLLQESIDLENLKTTEGLEGTTFNELMKTYDPNRFLKIETRDGRSTITRSL